MAPRKYPLGDDPQTDWINLAFQSFEARIDEMSAQLAHHVASSATAERDVRDLYAQTRQIAIDLESLRTMPALIVKLSDRLEQAHAEHNSMALRIVELERCRELIDQHIDATDLDHQTFRKWKNWATFLAWIIASIGTVLGTAVGLFPMIEYMTRHRP